MRYNYGIHPANPNFGDAFYFFDPTYPQYYVTVHVSQDMDMTPYPQVGIQDDEISQEFVEISEDIVNGYSSKKVTSWVRFKEQDIKYRKVDLRVKHPKFMVEYAIFYVVFVDYGRDGTELESIAHSLEMK